MIAGCFGGEHSKDAIGITQFSCNTIPSLQCNAEESDTRVWLHAFQSVGHKKLVVSPDTDVYNIGIALLKPDLFDVFVQLCPHFFENAWFICSALAAPGTLADTHPHNMKDGCLSFLRLVGSMYFKKHLSSFTYDTPPALYNSLADPTSTMLEQHKCFIHNIREMVSDKNEMITREVNAYGFNGKLEYKWESDENQSIVRHQRVSLLLRGCSCASVTACTSKRCGCVK